MKNFEITIRSDDSQVLQKILAILAGAKAATVSNGETTTRGPGKKNGRGPNKRGGIGQSVNRLIRGGKTNQEIFDYIHAVFPSTKMRAPTSVNFYRSKMRRELRNKRADTRKKKIAREKRLTK